MLDDWYILDFPENTSLIYVIFIVKEKEEKPLYVGETDRLYGRIWDYMSAQFGAPTDFKVGEAIKYFRGKGYKIIIKYKFSNNRKKDENTIIKSFQSQGFRILNDLKGYKYREANESEERNRIQKFCDKMMF
jgi:hypothetical protein